ncbi:MAG: peroxiredoxin [Bacteroidota bacterium]
MPLKIGDKASSFTLIDTERKPRSLSEFQGKKLVLAFYPGAFTGVCQKEFCTFRDSMTNLGSLNAQIVGISVDSPFANKAFAAQNNLPFPLLSDYTRAVSEQYGGVYKDFAGLTGYTASKRAVFVIDPLGVIKYVWISENPGVEPNYNEINNILGSI